MTIQSSRPGIPADILALSHERDELRKRGKYDRADALKRQIEEAGYSIKDNPHGAHLIVLPSVEVDGVVYRTVRQVPSLLDEVDRCEFSVHILANTNFEETKRCVESVMRCMGTHEVELLLVNNKSLGELDSWFRELQQHDSRLHLLSTSRPLGVAEARNVSIKQSRGKYIVLLDTSVELVGDVFTPIEQILADPSVGITGFRGLSSEDLHHFEESTDAEVEVIDELCMAFQRTLLKKIGLFDESYRFAYYMAIDFNFAVRNSGVRAVVTPNLPIKSYPPFQDATLSDAERTRLKKRNFYRFLDKWGGREDLLLNNEEWNPLEHKSEGGE
ncbi:MAG TPA: glycosyltransferase [Ktedonobacteraceae bacterium]|nr:glycosyltransferase [Ktedonobacteraceae bacterium]